MQSPTLAMGELYWILVATGALDRVLTTVGTCKGDVLLLTDQFIRKPCWRGGVPFWGHAVGNCCKVVYYDVCMMAMLKGKPNAWGSHSASAFVLERAAAASHRRGCAGEECPRS